MEWGEKKADLSEWQLDGDPTHSPDTSNSLNTKQQTRFEVGKKETNISRLFMKSCCKELIKNKLMTGPRQNLWSTSTGRH